MINKKKYSNLTNNIIAEKILQLYRKGKYYEALNYIKEYNQLYPKDIKGKYIEAKLLRLMNNPLEAKNILTYFYPTIAKTNEFYYKIIFELIYIEIDLKNYHQALNYYQEYISLEHIDNFDLSFLKTFLLSKLGYFKNNPNLDNYSFYEKQLIRYDKKECLDYNQEIVDHQNDLNPFFSYFYSNIDLEALYLKVEALLPYAMDFKSYSLFKNYLINFPRIGFDLKGNLNYIRVATTEVENELKIVNITPIRLNIPKTNTNHLNNLELKRMLSHKIKGDVRK